MNTKAAELQSVKQIIFILILFNNFISFSQHNVSVLNGFKYIYMPTLKYESGRVDVWSIAEKVDNVLSDKGLKTIYSEDEFEKIKYDFNKVAYLDIYHSRICEGCGVKKVELTFSNFKDEIIYKSSGSGLCLLTLQCEVDKAVNNSLREIYSLNYKYDENKTPKLDLPNVEKVKEDESSLVEYFDNNYLDEIEGIYKNFSSSESGYYKFAVKKYGNIYKAIIIETNVPYWSKGEVKAIIEKTSMNKLYSTQWFSLSKERLDVFMYLTEKNILSFEIDTPDKGKTTFSFIKMYPQISDNRNNNKNSSIVKSSGTGFIISSDGYVSTNFHVVKDYRKIELQFLIDNETKVFNAKIILKDEINDVAILKIEENNLNYFENIPYSINSDISVGEDVFTIGFPLNSIMGENFKLTNGVISSKTGIMDDIRFFQVSVPVQPGNSGGPLFNNKGDIIGITTSKLNESAAGTSIQNVNYCLKSNYLLNLIDMLPQIKINKNQNNKTKEIKDHFNILYKYICLIRTY